MQIVINFYHHQTQPLAFLTFAFAHVESLPALYLASLALNGSTGKVNRNKPLTKQFTGLFCSAECPLLACAGGGDYSILQERLM